MLRSPASSPGSSGICSARCRRRKAEGHDAENNFQRTDLRLRLRTTNRGEEKPTLSKPFSFFESAAGGGSSQGLGGWPMHVDVHRKRSFTAAPTHAPRQCGHDAPMYRRYLSSVASREGGPNPRRSARSRFHRDLHQRTRLCPVPVRCHRRRGISSAAFTLWTNIAFFCLIIRSYINVKAQPRRGSARLVQDKEE